jgi:hypothetical protein
MAHRIAPPTLKELFLSSLGCRQPSRTRACRTRKCFLELLEERCLLSTYTVSNTNFSGTGSLGAAISGAVAGHDAAADIVFSLPTGSTIKLNSSDVDPDAAQFGPTAFFVNGASGTHITIDGSGAPGLVIDGGDAVRPFVVAGGAALTLESLTLTGGNAQGGAGGVSEGGTGGGAAGLGGAVLVDGSTFTAQGCTFVNNQATGGHEGNQSPGGSIGGGGGGGLGGAGGAGNSRQGGAGGGLNGATAQSRPSGGFGGGGLGGIGGAGGFGGGGGGDGGGGGGGEVYGSGGGGAGGFGGGGGGGGGAGFGGAGGFGGGGGDYGDNGGGGGGLGGAVFSTGGTLTLTNDTFTKNAATGGAGGSGTSTSSGHAGQGYGGAVFVRNGTLTATSDTFRSNTVTNGNSTAGTASDLYVLSDSQSGIGYSGGTASATIVNSILGQNGTTTVSDFYASAINGAAAPGLTGSSHNLVSDDPASPNGLIGTTTPVPTKSTANLALNATQITIDGVAFDPIAANDTVTFNDGAIGTVSAATFNSLTVTFSKAPIDVGGLTAIVSADGVSSGAAVPVATVTPVVTSSTGNLAASASQITIKGLGFDPTAANDTVKFNDGAVGTVKTASTSALTVTFTTEPTTAGSLKAIVTTDSVSSGTAVQVATVTPVVTASTANLLANAPQITIKGFGFDPTAADNKVTFNDGAAGTVTTAGPTSLTVTFSSQPSTAGSLTEVVTTDSVSSGTAVQVATVTPVVTASNYPVAANATTFTFKGFGFDPTDAHDTVVFNDGAVGMVATANSTAMTVKFSTDPTTAGSLTVIVTIDDESSGAPVHVGMVTPVVTASTANLLANAPQITIKGFGFDPTAADNKVSFNDGAVGTVTTAGPTSLTVTFSTKPKTAGSLTAVVATDNNGVAENSGTAVQVATVTPVVTTSTANLAASATQITINGFGFDPTAANNTVVFNDGAVGTITAATATSLTVTFSTKPKNAGSLTVVVTTDNESSGNPVQVATVT